MSAATGSLQALYAGTNEAPPSTAPEAQADANVWVISCGEAAEGCSRLSSAAKEAGESVGWGVTVFDGNFGIGDAYQGGIRQAIAAGADAIVLNAIDCPYVTSAAGEAQAAGIPLISVLSIDCADELVGGEKLFTEMQMNSAHPSYPEWFEAWGAQRADAVVAATGGEANVLNIVSTDFLPDHYQSKGFHDRIAETCSDCEIQDLEFQIADLSTGALAQTFSSTFATDNTFNVVVAPYDSTFQSAGISQTLLETGRNDEVYAIGVEGHSPNIDLIRTNRGQDAALAYSSEWLGYGVIDTTIRVLAGEDPVPEGIGWQLVDVGHNLPDTGPYTADVNFVDAYRSAWGVN